MNLFVLDSPLITVLKIFKKAKKKKKKRIEGLLIFFLFQISSYLLYFNMLTIDQDDNIIS